MRSAAGTAESSDRIPPWIVMRCSEASRIGFRPLPDWPEHEEIDLAPLRWAETSARDDVRARLAANRFRALTLDARG